MNEHQTSPAKEQDKLQVTSAALSTPPPNKSKPLITTNVPQAKKPPLKFKISHRVEYLSDKNGVANKLKQKLYHYEQEGHKMDLQEGTLYKCLNNMLKTVAVTENQNIQDRQIKEVDQWFEKSQQLINIRTNKPPLYKTKKIQSKEEDSRNSINDLTQLNHSQKKALKPNMKQFLTIKAGRHKDSFKNSFNQTSSSFHGKESLLLHDSAHSEGRQQNKRYPTDLDIVPLSYPKERIMLSDFNKESPQYAKALNKYLLTENKDQMGQARVERRIYQSMLELGHKKKNKISLNNYNKEATSYSNVLNKFGIKRSMNSTQKSTTKSEKRYTPNPETKEMERQRFLDFENDIDLKSEKSDDEEELIKKRRVQPHQNQSQKRPITVIDLTKDNLDQYKEVFSNSMTPTHNRELIDSLSPPLLHQSSNDDDIPLTREAILEKLTYTQDKLKSIHASKIHKIRQYRADYLFAAQIPDNNTVDSQNEPLSQQPEYNYPKINRDKAKLDTAIHNQQAITLSCFTRPSTQCTFNRQKLSQTSFPGHNFNLMSKQDQEKQYELVEIQNLQKGLAQNEIVCQTDALQKAIFYENERDPSIDIQFGIRSRSQPKEFKYPDISDLLLINPFKKKDNPFTKPSAKRKVYR